MKSMFYETRWSGVRPPTADDIAAMARQAWQILPDTLRCEAGDIAIAVEEFPDEDTLDELGCETAFDVMALFRTPEGGPGSKTTPAMLVLFRRPLLDFWAEQEEPFATVLAHVMVQEAGHQLGFSDDELARIEQEAQAGADASRTMQ